MIEVDEVVHVVDTEAETEEVLEAEDLEVVDLVEDLMVVQVEDLVEDLTVVLVEDQVIEIEVEINLSSIFNTFNGYEFH